MLLALPAYATFPAEPWPDCSADAPESCPGELFDEDRWGLWSFLPEGWAAADPMAPGLGADLAWREHVGRADVVIAVLDSGARWENGQLRRKYALNTAELPLPEGASGYDADGDGVVTVDDWAADSRVALDAGVDAADGVLDPSDLLAAFSDGVDDDGNAYVDDIAGWDFVWNDNDPFDDTDFGHGEGMAEYAAAEADGEGDLGVCPNCTVLNLRVGDAFVHDGATVPAAIVYAVDNGSAVIHSATGSISWSDAIQQAADHAWAEDVVFIGSAGDETAYHHNPPGRAQRTVYVHAVRHDGDSPAEATSFLRYANCTNHGPRLDLSVPSDDCSSGATGMAGGAAGLLLSAARDRGITLSAAEAWQLLVGQSEDIALGESAETYPSAEGWDAWFGQGRLDVGAAVAALDAIPPVAELREPEWMAWLSPGQTLEIHGSVAAPRSEVARWTLRWGAGEEPASWTTIAEGEGAVDGLLASWTVPEAGPALSDWALGSDPVSREREVMAALVSLRLEVEDVEGRVGQARAAAWAQVEPDLLPGFPMRLGGSLESSPTLADLDGDGVFDLVQADGAGWLHALSGGVELPGFPVHAEALAELDPEGEAHHRDAPGWSVVDPDQYAPLSASPAVGDLDGDGSPEVVAASLRGKLWAWHADGTVVDGFPVAQLDVVVTDEDHTEGEGFLSSPALYDLDDDGRLEIVCGGMDQRLYVWTADGAAFPGFPLRLAYPGYETSATRIVSSPTVGDLTGDGVAEILIGTNEKVGDQWGALYAVKTDGSVLDGWPVQVFSLYNAALPIVGEGFPGSAALADFDGDGQVEVVAHALAGDVVVLGPYGEDVAELPTAADRFGPLSNVNDSSTLPLFNSPSVGDVNGDGTPDVVTGCSGFDYARGQDWAYGGDRFDFDHAICGWDGLSGEFLAGFPRVVEDLTIFQNPAIADLDGDGAMEVIATSGGGVVHAWNADGVEPAGWPKRSGGWSLATPAVGDIDGDGLLDVVVGTREGWLFAWSTSAPTTAPVAWAGFGHDAAHTHDSRAPLPGYNLAEAGEKEPEPEDCGCAATPTHGWLAIAGLALLRRRR